MEFVVKLLFSIPFVALARTRVSDMEWQNFHLVNKLRAEGFTCPEGEEIPPNPQPLVFECRLWNASLAHSQEMADQDFFGEDSLDGTTWWDRATAYGASATALNLGVGAPAQEVLDLWLRVDWRCRLIGDPLFRYYGVGHASNAASTWEDYWTQMFGDFPPIGGVDASCYPTDVSSTNEQQLMAATTGTTAAATSTSTAITMAAATIAATTTTISTETITKTQQAVTIPAMASSTSSTISFDTTTTASAHTSTDVEMATTATSLRGSVTTTVVATTSTGLTSSSTTDPDTSEVGQVAFSGSWRLQGKISRCLLLVIVSSLLSSLL
jgi:uncharacterized protein YkwD